MPKDSSVAPKERINIRYKPATGDQREDVELPFKQVVLGEFGTKPDDTPIGERKLLGVDKDNFNDVMRSQDLSLDLAVDNRLDDPKEGQEAGKLAVSLKFETLKDFEPDAVAKQVPELQKILELREALLALKGPLGNVPAFRKTLQGLLQDDEARKKLLDELDADAKS